MGGLGFSVSARRRSVAGCLPDSIHLIKSKCMKMKDLRTDSWSTPDNPTENEIKQMKSTMKTNQPTGPSYETDWPATSPEPTESNIQTHDSHPLGVNEVVNMSVVPMWGFPDPPEMEWAVWGLIPSGYMTTLAAHGGMGKSYLAIRLAISVATGTRFLGMPVKLGKVLFVDAELDVLEQQRRLNRVLRGLNLSNDILGDRSRTAISG